MSTDDSPRTIDTTVAHPARRYDYWLGGKDNFAPDRTSGDAIEKVYPHIRTAAVQNRQFLRRVVQYLAKEAGIRQFLDIGTGLPTADNTHEVAQAINPVARIVYVDNDPLVLVHARALLTSHPDGRTAYIDADLRDTAAILGSSEVADNLDLSEPVSISLIAVLQFIIDEAQAHAIVDALLAPFPAGSTLAISTVTAHNEQAVAGAAAYRARGIDAKARTDAEVTDLFRGLDLVDPGVVLVNRWRPEAQDAEVEDFHVQMSGGVGVKR
jgi:hypothetical protein